MTSHNSCGGCSNCGGCAQSAGCSGCSGCGGALYLTPAEYDLLTQLAVLPFLPVGFNRRGKHPVCLDTPGDPEQVTDALLGLERMGLISLDPEVPLQGFDYAAYADCPLQGSLALTARGQRVLDQLALEGIDETP